MTLPGILLIGAGGHAHACIDVIESSGQFVIDGLIGQRDEIGRKVLGYSVLGCDADLPTLARRIGNVLLAVGQISSAQLRQRLAAQLEVLGVNLPIVIAPDAHVSRHAQIAAGTIVMHGAIVNAGARVGRHCIINSRALIEHDAQIGSFCHVSTGAIVNGDAVVGDGSFLGSGSVLRHGISVGQNCVVGMGLAVRHHQPDQSIFLG
jgi:sugar O-acyltransferase (sialic acid O-acetyltransferase NeuD family)